jgi:putative NADH-flavin reductase
MLLLLFALYAVSLSAALALAGLRAPVAVPVASDRRRPTRVLIVGATGGTGRQLVAQALEQGFEVTALVRNPSALRIEHSRLRITKGDVLDYDSVEATMSGQEAVISALGHKKFFFPTRVLSEGTRNLLRAMGTHGVRRLVCETSLGIGGSGGRMGLYYTFFTIPLILPLYFWDKARQERVIAASKVEWVIVRPGVLNNGERRASYRHGPHVGSFLWTVRISRADVADFMLTQLTDDRYLGTAPGVCW